MKALNALLVILLLQVVAITSSATDFVAMDYYFDNSKVQFPVVKMIVGDTTNCRTIVLDMDTMGHDDLWKASFKKTMHDVDFYGFINQDLGADTINLSPLQLIDSLECELGSSFRHTALKETDEWGHVYAYWVFCPDYNINNSDGYWRPIDSYGITPSRSVPLVYINTENSRPIIDKIQYIAGTLWIDNCGIENCCSLGSEQEPLAIEIKGRGNWTWVASHKKPYKIKFATKQSPLGLDKSKHFILKPDCQDWSGYLRNETGFEVSRLLEMPYTPRQYPVEVMLNGEYIGLYFLCEKIRVESGRVEVVEQEDYETNPYNITGGWLLESRGYEHPIYWQFENNDPQRVLYAFESQSPELFSEAQQQYISSFISKTDSCIFVADKTDQGWEQFIDINSLARFYVIHEVMDNIEAFDGSLFLYKDWGENEKFHFGPVWDFDNSSMNTTNSKFIYQYDNFNLFWIEEICKFPRFEQEVSLIWKEFNEKDILQKAKLHAYQWRTLINGAEQQDAKRWRTYASVHSADAPQAFLGMIDHKVKWLDKQWGDGSGITTVTASEKVVIGVKFYNLQGVPSDNPFEGFNIRVTTYSDGSRSSEKVVR